MSKKQFEDIEHKIREAAENNQPPFQEDAWDKMNALLDKEDNKKRPVPFMWASILLLLMVAGGSYWYLNRSSNQTDKQFIVKEEKKNTNTTIPDNEQKDNIKPQETNDIKNLSAESITTKTTAKENNITSKEITTPEQNTKQHSTTVQLKTHRAAKKEAPALHRFNKKGKMLTQSSGSIDESADETKKEITDEDPTNDKNETVSSNEIGKAVQELTDNITNKKDTAADKLTAANENKQENKTTPVVSKQDKKVNSTYKPSKFYFLAAIGAEAASTKFLSFNDSKFSPTYGIGVGYSITKKLSIQTGFYAGAKKYIAGPKDYHPKPGSYWSDVYIKKVDANCMVYEIPVTIRYSFLQKRKTEYFITAGASSYIMKKEDYMYNYMRNYIPYSDRYVYTGNKHLFSALTFSTGIDKRLSQQFSLIAAPTFSIPVSGVGDGKVKLFSAGITAGLKYQPAKKK